MTERDPMGNVSYQELQDELREVYRTVDELRGRVDALERWRQAVPLVVVTRLEDAADPGEPEA